MTIKNLSHAKKYFAFIVIVSALISCSTKKDVPELLSGKFSTQTMCLEEPKPTFNIEQDNLKEILILMHSRISSDEIKNHFNWNDSVWNEKVNILFGEGLIKKLNNGNFVPTCFVLDTENGMKLKKFTDSLGAEMSGIITDRLGKVRGAYQNVPSLRNIPFNNISMFVLGAVMHDLWQMKFYQEEFIKAFVPHRGTARYYLSIIQNDESTTANVKIYETKLYDFPSFQFGTFARTGEENSITSYATSKLQNEFGKESTISDSLYQIVLINELIKMNRDAKYFPNQSIADGLNKNGLISNGKSCVPFISKSDQQKLYSMASIIKIDLLNYFDNRQTVFVKYYLNSQYREETSYKEWMMWINKMISARVVDLLIEKSIIKAPIGRTASFILEK